MPFKRNDNRISQKGYDAELVAEKILESEGYKILYNPEGMKRQYRKDRDITYFENTRKKRDFAESIIGESLMPEINRKEWEKVLGTKIEKSLFRLTYVDLFCKKNRDYYIFEVKHKTFKEKSNLNSFSVTNYEVLNFNRISNEGKVKLKVLIILEKEKKSFYRIFDWSDFAYSQNYDPHKTPTTNIRLREGFNISQLVKI